MASTPIVSSASSPPPNVVINKKTPKPSTIKKSYVQASKANISSNIDNVIQIKEAFPSLSANKVGKMLKAKNSRAGIQKPKINMTTKEPLRKEIIIPMAKANAELIINLAHIHISNVNNCLKTQNQTQSQISFI